MLSCHCSRITNNDNLALLLLKVQTNYTLDFIFIIHECVFAELTQSSLFINRRPSLHCTANDSMMLYFSAGCVCGWCDYRNLIIKNYCVNFYEFFLTFLMLLSLFSHHWPLLFSFHSSLELKNNINMTFFLCIIFDYFI